MKKEVRQNKEMAWLFYGYSTKESREGMVLHHIDTSLRHTDRARYEEWRVEDVIPLTHSTHIRIHKVWCYHTHHSEETKAAISAKLKGVKKSYTHRVNMGKHWRQTIWITNGTDCRRLYGNQPIPTGWVQGRIIKHRRTKKEMRELH